MAGETALARQLKKLAVPQTTILLQDKIRKSFLFDHRDAAGLDKDTVFAYGTNGLEKLHLINRNFSKFESNLFSFSYKDFERSVQSKDINAKLDEKISEFLRMLSPYFLVRGAHEALEWLIYRFHIHMFNVDDLIASVLPHYNTSTFVRVIQLLDLNEGSRWFWLKPIQKSGVHLEYSAILNRFISDDGFRKFVCNIAPNAISVYKDNLNAAVPVISFSMITIYNALVKCKSIDDKLVVILFPYILKGLKSKFSQYTAASYLVISQIVVNVKLTPTVTEELLIIIFQAVKDNLTYEAFQLLLLVFQNQSLKSLPKEVHSVIVSNSGSVELLCVMTETFDTDCLVQAIIKKTLAKLFTNSISPNAKQHKKLMNFLKDLLTEVKLNETSVALCFNFTMKKYIKCSKKVEFNRNKSYNEAVKIILKSLEMKYSNSFDKALKSFLEKQPKLDKKISFLINDSVCSMKHKMITDTKTPLVIGLNHANPQIRKTAVIHLLETLKKGNFTEKEFLINAVYDRLLDKNPDVVEAVLSCLQIILNVLGKSKILCAFEEIFKNGINKKGPWYSTCMKCLQIVVNNFSCGKNVLVLPLILKFIFPVNVHTLEGFLLIINSNLKNFLIEELKTLKSEISEDGMNEEKYTEINCKILFLLKRSIDKMDQASRNLLVTFMSSKISLCKCHSFLSFYLHAMQHLIIVDRHNAVQHTEDFLQVLRKYFTSINLVLEKTEDISELVAVKQFEASFMKNELPASILLYTLKNVVGTDKTLENTSWPDTGSRNYRILSKVFDFCILSLNSHRGILEAYFKNMLLLLISQLKKTENVFKFLCTKWINYEDDTPCEIKLSSLNIAREMCEGKNMDWMFEDEAVFFCLLKAITDTDSSVSHLALDLLSWFLNCSENCKYPLKFLAEAIKSQNEKIKIDITQCFSCVGNFVMPSDEAMEAKSVQVKNIEDLEKKKAVLQKMLALLSKKNVPYIIKHFLLLCLQSVDSVNILSAYIPTLCTLLSELQKVKANKEKLAIIELLLKKFNAVTAKCLHDNCNETKVLLDCLKYNNKNEPDDTVQKLALDVLTKDFFSALPSVPVQQEIFNTLLELYLNSSTTLNAKIAKTLKKLCVNAYLFLKHFQEKELNVSRGTTLREAKKSRTDENIDTLSTFEKGSWKKMTVFLEVMQNKSKLLQKNVLIPELFNLLNKSLDFESQPPVEYVRQLILSLIYSCCQELGSERLDERQFQVELIVQCIRSSTNAKTHQQSLLLLNLAARMFPDYVLTNVMSIFTFMGSSLVRQDDSYSFQVISQTIETIVPSLLEASNQQTEVNGIQVVASFIRVFVDALSDIPSHRQLPLFNKLLSTLDPSKFLWIPIGQICDQHATVFHNIMTDNKNWKISPALEFAVNLHKQFSPNIQLDTCIELANLLSMLPDTKQQLESNPEKYKQVKEPFNVINRDNKQLQVYKYNILSYMKIWLSSQEFLNQVSELYVKEQHNLEVKYELLFETVLKLLQDRLNIKESNTEDRNIINQIQILHDLVYAINSLLPYSLFIRVVGSLLKNAELEIQVKAIEFLNTKLEQQQDLKPENKKSLQKLLRPLLKLVEKCVNEETEEKKTTNIQQTALYSLHLLCKLIGSEYPTKFYKVLNISIQILQKYTQPELIANALLCLAQLCNCLNVNIFPHLNSFMPVIVNILQDRKISTANECLVLGIIAAMHSIIENLGVFLSRYMMEILTGICMLSVKYSELGKNNICEKIEALQNKISKEIPLRVLLIAVENSYLKITSQTSTIAVPLMKILTEKLNSCTCKEVLSSAPELQKFYLTLLDFRNNYQDVPHETTNDVENYIISSFKTFVMKLPVSRFRTLFQKVYQWATTTVEDQEQKCRIYTFYKLTSEFSKSLKSLFARFSKYFFRHIATVLDSNNVSKSKTCYFEKDISLSHQLLLNSVDTLNFCFMHAEDQFLDKENFEILMQPLVDQIENLDVESRYQDLIENHLGSCIAYFITAVSDNAMWKALNYQMLLKTRHSSPKVRFGSLQVIQKVVSMMGDNYLVLLPESIPFFSEIMEDESTEVEQECQTVITEMEKILGEPIRKYF